MMKNEVARFTEEELADIDPVIAFYMRRIDRKALYENLQLTPQQRIDKMLRSIEENDERQRVQGDLGEW